MQEEEGIEANLEDGDEYAQCMQMMRIGIEGVSPPENCTVAYGMDEQKRAQHKPSQSHDVLFTQR